MIAVVQRVSKASVEVDHKIVGEIGKGLMVLASIVREDTDKDFEWMAKKLSTLRIFPNADSGFDLDVQQVGGAILLVSNFTVSANTSGGRRPSFIAAMPPDQAREAFPRFVEIVRATGVPVETGEFAADMLVRIENDGPVTVIVDSKKAG
ncbi:MAG TPA: D-aminoacyl-tRNA deacylase [Tepidisphaeraceae bacterium]|nr:D-aminoacyl-tRNA deacylase [Tepidisphaeraceae bacterium]